MTATPQVLESGKVARVILDCDSTPYQPSSCRCAACTRSTSLARRLDKSSLAIMSVTLTKAESLGSGAVDAPAPADIVLRSRNCSVAMVRSGFQNGVFVPWSLPDALLVPGRTLDSGTQSACGK